MNTDNDVETAEQALDFDEDLDNIEENAGKLTDDSPLKEKAEVIIRIAIGLLLGIWSERSGCQA